jgi:hypothetical protein
MVFLLFAIAVPTAFSQENLLIAQDTVLTFVHDFLQVFYPELISRGHRLKLSVMHPADSSWREMVGVYFTVMPESPPDYEPSHCQNGKFIPEVRSDPNSVLLDGNIWLPLLEHGSRVQLVLTSPDSANEQKLTAFRNLVESHPEWSDEQAIIAPQASGRSLRTEGQRRVSEHSSA